MTDDARAALHEMRVYARHAPLCAYSPTYPRIIFARLG